jgi:hypothetical protein
MIQLVKSNICTMVMPDFLQGKQGMDLRNAKHNMRGLSAKGW